MGYEGLRKCDFNRTAGKCLHGQAFGPFATGDWCEALNCTDVGWPCSDDGTPCSKRSDRVLYGGGALGVLGAVVATTNESAVLRINVLATDVYAEDSPPLFLYYNPTNSTLWVAVVGVEACGMGQLYDLVDHATGRELARRVDCSGMPTAAPPASVQLAPDTAPLVGVRPLSERSLVGLRPLTERSTSRF